EVAPPILDSGAIQFQSGHLRLGQISRTLTDLAAPIDAAESERQIRMAIGHQLPALAALLGTWHRCHVSFSRDSLPLVGPVPGIDGVQTFTGFSSPFSLLPPIAERFAKAVMAGPDPWLAAMGPDRFTDKAKI
ncbi:FAD-dependent oxidoreductase, partial [filamentous cyanobacterium CCP5]